MWLTSLLRVLACATVALAPLEGYLLQVHGQLAKAVPAALIAVWLISLAPRSEWESSPFGPAAWWLMPALLVAISCILPAALFFLHGRYVLELKRAPDGGWVLTTFLVWGRRRRLLPADALKGAKAEHDDGRLVTGLAPTVNAPSLTLTPREGSRLIFDQQGDAPQGWEAIERLCGPR